VRWAVAEAALDTAYVLDDDPLLAADARAAHLPTDRLDVVRPTA
jgi:hypothetical protein